MSQEKLSHYIRKVILFWTGLCLICVGVVGLVLPLAPGILIILAGAGIVSRSQASYEEHNIQQKLRRLYDCVDCNKNKIISSVRSELRLR